MLADLVVGIVRRIRLGIRVAVTGRVDSFDATTGSATIRPDVPEQNLEAGAVRTLPVSAVPGVPVLMHGGSRRGLTYGLASGDPVLMVVRHRSHDEVDSGTEALPTTPTASRRMDYSDAVALPGYVAPGRGRPASQFRSDGQLVAYMGAGESMHVGASTAALDVARADLVTAQLDALLAAISTAPVVSGDGGAAFKAAILASLAAWPSPVASSRLKVDS